MLHLRSKRRRNRSIYPHVVGANLTEASITSFCLRHVGARRVAPCWLSSDYQSLLLNLLIILEANFCVFINDRAIK
jgi:hypothetical protein